MFRLYDLGFDLTSHFPGTESQLTFPDRSRSISACPVPPDSLVSVPWHIHPPETKHEKHLPVSKTPGRTWFSVLGTKTIFSRREFTNRSTVFIGTMPELLYIRIHLPNSSRAVARCRVLGINSEQGVSLSQNLCFCSHTCLGEVTAIP